MREKYIESLLKMLDYLTDEGVRRVYNLVEYLYIHKQEVNVATETPDHGDAEQ